MPISPLLSGTTAKAEIDLQPMAGHLPYDLVSAIKQVYEPAGIKLTKAPVRETESEEYGASRLSLNGQHIAFRIAKTTPTKIGHFVTIWKRAKPSSATAPLDFSDGIKFVIVHVSDGKNRGQFIFDQKTLCDEGIFSHQGKVGKMAFRLYAPWTKPEAKQAIKTQQWQLRYFLTIAPNGTADPLKVRQLFKI